LLRVLIHALALLLATASLLVLGLATQTVAAQRRGVARVSAVTYECPMHPEVTSPKPGKCPKCGMALRGTTVRRRTSSARASMSLAAAAPVEKPGETLTKPRIPDASVVDQDGRRLKFYTDLVKGKTVAINFIFTTCTAICPVLTATMRRVQQQLGERAGRDVQLISISVDPTTDVPERLQAYAQKFKAAPGWTFVTGSRAEIASVLQSLGAYSSDKNDHTPLVLIGNEPAGYWTRVYGAAPASSLVSTIEEAVSRTARPATGSRYEGGGPTNPEGGTAGASGSAAAKYFPNLALTTQDNRRVHFYDDLLKGKVVLINFVFTTCQGVCSPMTANLARVQNYLVEHMDREVVMISISVDPETDTPERLKEYADKFKAKPGWYFLTGEKRNVDWVLYKLGGYVADKQQHSSVLIIGNEATGEWLKVLAMSNPSEIASAVTRLLQPATSRADEARH
jgi:cytochrome oxidase Cu insertion factor (SCO1/SenC/PrrC family)